MGVLVNLLIYFSNIKSNRLLIIAAILSSLFLSIKLLAWFRVFNVLSRIPGPKGIPILGVALIAIGDGECKFYSQIYILAMVKLT